MYEESIKSNDNEHMSHSFQRYTKIAIKYECKG